MTNQLNEPVSNQSAVYSIRRKINNDVNVSNQLSQADWAVAVEQLSSTDIESDACTGEWEYPPGARKRARRRSKLQDAGLPGHNTPSLSLLSSTPGKLSQKPVGSSGQSMTTYRAIITQGESNANFNSTTMNARSQQSKRQPMLVGRRPVSGAGVGTTKITAAKPYIGKTVLCVDNVSCDVGEADLEEFLKRNGITVLSCHIVKPRRSRWQRETGVIPANRRTFRLCIPREQSNMLLKPDFWPAYITISPWIFSKRPQPEVDDAQRSLPTDSTERSDKEKENVSVAAGDVVVEKKSVDGHERENVCATSVVLDTSSSSSSGSGKDMDTTIMGYYDAQ